MTTRWRIAIVFEVDATSEEEATQVGEDLCNAITRDVAGETWDGTWVASTDATVWGGGLGPMDDD